MDLINQVKEAIEKSQNGYSKLPFDVINIGGFTSKNIKVLLNNLGEIPDMKYLEIGLHRGATFFAANYGNKFLSSTGIDNWCEFGEEASRREFMSHLDKLKPNCNIIDGDCFSVDKNRISSPINFYLYDGPHRSEDQANSLSYYYDILDDTFIYCVDDWNWDFVRNGTLQGIKDSNFNTLFSREFFNTTDTQDWWNGFVVMVLQKGNKN